MELIDHEVIEFYNQNKMFNINSNIKQIPKAFKSWRDDLALTYKFYEWINLESYFTSFPLNIKVPHEEILLEALENQHLFVSHRNVGNHSGWYSMAIHGTAIEHTYQREKYYTEDNMPDYDWTELAARCVKTKEWLLSLGFKTFDRVRFMRLDPNGYIKPHSDKSRTKKTSIAWNVAINNPEGHNFVMEGEGLIPWKPGEIRVLDVGRKHSVFNISSTPRIHMIIHGIPGDNFIKITCESYEELIKNS